MQRACITFATYRTPGYMHAGLKTLQLKIILKSLYFRFMKLIAGTIVLVWGANHSLHYIAASQAAGAAAVAGVVQSAVVLWLHIHCTKLDACSALSAVRSHKTLSIALPRWQKQLCPKSPFCRQQQEMMHTSSYRYHTCMLLEQILCAICQHKPEKLLAGAQH